MNNDPQFILASASPRRAELLGALGLRFRVMPQHIDETRQGGEGLEHYVSRLAREKAQAAAQAGLPALGADTVVAVDGEALGKPDSREHAVDMLQRLAGRSHEVLTAVAVVEAPRCEQALRVSRVRFRAITPAEAVAYWNSGEPADKAGGYAIQGLGGIFVEHLEGSHSGVVGLPVFETARLLQKFGIPVLAC